MTSPTFFINHPNEIFIWLKSFIMKFNIFICISLLSLSVYSQGINPNQSGVYLTSNDYLNNILTYSIDCSTESHKIKLHDFNKSSHIDVIHNKIKYTLQKKEIYAFKDCENGVYRFFNNEEYKILEPKAIYIYSIEKNIPSGKNIKTITEYYFSKDSNGDLVKLSLINLKKAFPENHKFHDLLDAYFKDETDITMYDSFHKMHKINHLYQQSLIN